MSIYREEKKLTRGEKFQAVAKRVLAWVGVLMLISGVASLAYLNVQLKADKQIARAEMHQQELAGQVEILQATIVKLQMEGEVLEKSPLPRSL